MNFEFLNGLAGLGKIYKSCSNAEKLAISMPEQSVFTSRKSAELIAKFIYLAAHNQIMEGMTFKDVLDDLTFRRFIGNRDVIDAFHYIRKKGNQAAHSDDQEPSAEEAIDVLQDLHYVAGETACMLGLIDDYPYFEDHIAAFPEEKYVPIESVSDLALEMFIAYAQEYEAQQERNSYIEQKDYDSLMVVLCLLFGLLVPAAAASGFQDVPGGAYYADAVDWAVGRQITNGTSNSTFSPS